MSIVNPPRRRKHVCARREGISDAGHAACANAGVRLLVPGGAVVIVSGEAASLAAETLDVPFVVALTRRAA